MDTLQHGQIRRENYKRKGKGHGQYSEISNHLTGASERNINIFQGIISENFPELMIEIIHYSRDPPMLSRKIKRNLQLDALY